MTRWSAVALAALLAAPALAQQVPNPVSGPIRQYQQKNFYVSPSGSDSADCRAATTSGGHGPCLTIKRALGRAMMTDAMPPDAGPTPNDNIIVNLAAGTYTENVTVSGNIPGLVSPHLYDTQYSSPQILLKGAGSASTTIVGTPTVGGNNYCYTIFASNGAYLSLEGLSVRSDTPGPCPQSNLYVQLATMYALADVKLLAATGNHIMLEETANFYVAPGVTTPTLTLAGNAYYGIVAATNSMFASDSTINITGPITMAGDILFLADEHSVIKLIAGNPAVTSGASVTGRRYWLQGNSFMTVGFPPAVWPGRIGMVASGGRLRSSDAQVCIGGSAGCVTATAPTGLGSGGIAGRADSGGYGGVVQLTAGAGAAAAGSVSVGWPYEMNRGSCAPALASGTGNWSPRATVQTSGFTGAAGMIFTWDNNAVPLANGSTYYFSYVCNTSD